MFLTEEVTTKVKEQVSLFDNDDLVKYNNTYSELYKSYPNFYYKYMIECSAQEMQKRGLGP